MCVSVSLVSAYMYVHGSGYISDPVVDVFHPGTDIQVCRCVYLFL